MTRCRVVVTILFALCATPVAHAQLAASMSLPPLDAPRHEASGGDPPRGLSSDQAGELTAPPSDSTSGSTDYRGAMATRFAFSSSSMPSG